MYSKLVGQEAAPKKCALIHTSKKVREEMKDCLGVGGGHTWTVELDVRDLGGHLDATHKAGANTHVE